MATLKGMPAYTGSMGGVSAYKMRGVSQIVLREKGGPTRQQVKTGAQFTITRKRNEEWKGTMLAVKNINLAMHGVRHLADYNSTGALSKICRAVQDEDKTPGSFGKRSLLFSQYGYKLEGYGLNMYHPFDGVLKYPLQPVLNKELGMARIQLPEIIPGIHLSNPLKQPFYRLVFVLGVVADIVFDERRNAYCPVADVVNDRCVVQTEWSISTEATIAQTLELSMADWQLQAGISLVLSAGVEYGQPASGGIIKFTKYAGAGKVVRVG
jgi:hypothetical protein